MFSEYPKSMSHPQFQPAILSGYRRNPDGTAADDPPGRPALNPPVYVNNRDQELEYASRGYLPDGTSDAEAYMRAVLGADTPAHFEFIEYPKYLYQANEDAEIKSVLVKSEQEERALSGVWYATPGAAMESPAEVQALEKRRGRPPKGEAE